MTSASEIGAECDAVVVGEIPVFAVTPDAHETVRKLTEESAEVFGAWERYRWARERVVAYTDPAMGVDGLRDASDALLFAETDLHDEIADVLQAVANLCAAIGVDDLRPAIRRCRERNERRDRIYA